MMTHTRVLRCLLMAGSLCAASTMVNAAQLTFKDTWKDTTAHDVPDQIYYVNTTGSFSATISLPLNGVDLSEADAGTQFSFEIGPAGSPMQIIYDTLGDAENYSPGKKSGKFPITDPNTGNTVGSVTVSWTATTITVTGSASEDFLEEEQTFSENSDGIPTTSTLNSSITGLYYEVILTLDASDNGGGTYNYDNLYVKTTGSDTETEYNPPDGSNPFPLETGSITGTGDFTPSVLTISSPAANFKVYDANPVVDLIGTASDGEAVSNIQCFVNGDTNNSIEIDQSEELPTNKISWTAEVDLRQFGQVGSNIVTVMAQDLSGNQTSHSRVFLWIETNSAIVTVNPANAGTVKGIKNGQVLQVASRYAVTATPANKNWIFSEWTDDMGDVLSSNATFEYYDTDAALTANFETNFFYNTSLAGTYTGLFYDTNNGVDLDDAGFITLTVTPTGGYSGKLYVASNASPFTLSGQLAEATNDSAAGANFKIKVSKSLYLNVGLAVATDTNLMDPGAGTLSGFVNAFSDPTETNELDSAQIQGELSFYNTNVANIIPGLYNGVIQPVSGDPSQGPSGYSFGSATVSKKGAVAIVLHLADGVTPAISFSSFTARDGTCPFYWSLYGVKGVILGWLQFTTNGSGEVQANSVNWLKLPVADKFYTNGFSASPTLIGGLYAPPKAGTNLFGWTEGECIIDMGVTGMGLPDETDFSVTFNPVKNTFSDTNKITITLTPSTGALAGTFYPMGAKTPETFHGVEIHGAGAGFYTSTNKETGRIWVGSRAAGGPDGAAENSVSQH